jgi:hypothetical protein
MGRAGMYEQIVHVANTVRLGLQGVEAQCIATDDPRLKEK